MGMSTWVIGLRTKDDPTYKKHLAVLEACKAAKIEELPKESAEYWGSKWPSDINPEDALQMKVPAKEWNDGDMQVGYELKVSDIPQGVEVIRFVNSY